MHTKVQIKMLGGAADNNLTGSCLLLEIVQGKRTLRVLIDAGLIQGGFTDSLVLNQEILKNFKPSEVDYIVITHSHIDHIGRLPFFCKNGFSGRIICTTGTRNLLRPMLEDSAKIQMAEAVYIANRAQKEAARERQSGSHRGSLYRGNYDRIRNRAKDRQKKNHILPLYTLEDVELVEALVKNGGYDYDSWIRLAHGVKIKFYPSGHVMGGGIVVVQVTAEPKPINLCFTGDLGRKDGMILPPPAVVKEPLDALFMESTYGGRSHPSRDEEIAKLLEVIRRAYDRKERIIIPSFALERSQEIIYLLSHHIQQKDIPAIPIYLDSPLGTKITAAFSAGWEEGMFADQNSLKLDFNPFDPGENKLFHILSSQEESDNLIARSGPYLVIAGSGMCDAGRVRGHLRANLSKSNTVVCLIGYMAENSLGRKLKDGHHTVRMNKEEIIVNAKIISFDSFSAHADSPFLTEYACSVLRRHRLGTKKVFLIHGSQLSAHELKSDLQDALPSHISIEIPKINERISIR